MADWTSLDSPHPVTRSNDSHGFTNPLAISRAEYVRIAAIPSIYRVIRAPATASSDIEQMDAGEKAAVDAAAVTAGDDAEMARLSLRDALTALALTVLDEVNILRTQHGLATRSTAQLKSAIRTKLESL